MDVSVEQIRLECLRLAVEWNKGNSSDDLPIQTAEKFAKFVNQKPKGRPPKAK